MIKLLIVIVFTQVVSFVSVAIASDIEVGLIRASQLGNLDAQKELATRYLDRKIEGNEVNKLKTFRWVRRLADEGDSSAQMLTASMYYAGIGVTQNEEEAVNWTKISADAGNVDAQLVMSYLYRSGDAGFEKSKRLAIEWALKAAEQGHPGAQRVLGGLYDSTTIGEPPVRDLEQSVKWNIAGYESYKSLAETGDMNAQWALAEIYFNGIEGTMINFDRVRAFEWYMKAAEQGHIGAQMAVATSYRNGGLEREKGYGVEKDEAKAVEWYKKAAELGAESAIYVLKNTYDIDISVAEE